MTSNRTAVVAGAGPVGATIAILLAQQGWQVQVFERANCPSPHPSLGDHRAYRLNLTRRGLRVLKLANVDTRPLIATQGHLLEAAFFKADGKTSLSASVPMTEDPPCVRAFRNEVASLIIKDAQCLYPDAIKIHFSAAVEAVDLDKQTICASLARSNGPDTVQVPYDLLVGADGAGSFVRSAIQQSMPAGYIRRYRHKQMYSMTQMVATDPEVPPHAVFQAHVMANKEGIVLWDGSGGNNCRVGLALPQEVADNLRHGETDHFNTMLEQSCPSLPSYARQGAAELAQSKPTFYPMPSWTHLTQLHGSKVVLLGDAAHTITPALGQGLNAGLEDAAVFAQCLEQHQGNVDSALLAYNIARLPDVQALMTINEVVSSADAGLACKELDAAHRIWVLGHRILFMHHMVLRTLLHKAVPGMIAGPSLLPLVWGPLPYRSFMSALYWDGIFSVGFLITAFLLALQLR